MRTAAKLGMAPPVPVSSPDPQPPLARIVPLMFYAPMGFGSDRKIRPRWTHTLGSMIDDYNGVQVSCDRCQWFKKLTRDDLIALAEIKGRDYSLWNRRCKCRLKAGCPGWYKFFYLRGVYRPMMDGARIYAL